jgi:hypothetical protein
MALGSTQYLTERNTSKVHWGKVCPTLKSDNLTAICRSGKSESLDISQPYGPPRSVKLFLLYTIVWVSVMAKLFVLFRTGPELATRKVTQGSIYITRKLWNIWRGFGSFPFRPLSLVSNINTRWEGDCINLWAGLETFTMKRQEHIKWEQHFGPDSSQLLYWLSHLSSLTVSVLLISVICWLAQPSPCIYCV